MVKALGILLFTVLSPLALLAVLDATAAEKFWLFGFSGHDLVTGGNQRLNHVRAGLADTYLAKHVPQNLQKNVRGGICVLHRNQRYRLEWNDSETEGFVYKVELHPDKSQSCSESYQKWPTFSLKDSELFPLTNLGGEVQFEVTTVEKIRRAMQAKGQQYSDRLRYTIRRDRKKTSDCGTGPQDIAVEFRFQHGVLASILMMDEIGGEC